MTQDEDNYFKFKPPRFFRFTNFWDDFRISNFSIHNIESNKKFHEIKIMWSNENFKQWIFLGLTLNSTNVIEFQFR